MPMVHKGSGDAGCTRLHGAKVMVCQWGTRLHGRFSMGNPLSRIFPLYQNSHWVRVLPTAHVEVLLGQVSSHRHENGFAWLPSYRGN